ncbi:hypothetical protein JB92DRAFT_3132870 [Gautieria morchelliformis]|nr:hypothetical protein JB92DRAFT_3132870 [Gautieria morchelliformis]
MFQQCLCEYEDVIKVHAEDTLHNHISENIVHHGLEGHQAVRKAEEHDPRFEQASVCPEGSLPLVPFPNPDIVESPSDIQLCKVPHALELVDELGDEWDQVPVLDRDCIQGLTGDPPGTEVFLQEVVQVDLLQGREWVHLAVCWLGPRLELDRMVPDLLSWQGVKEFFGKDLFKALQFLPLSVLLSSAGVAPIWAVADENLAGLPVNIQVMIVEPEEADDDVLHPKGGNYKCSPL